jgi:hypothetical protein
MFVSTTVVLSLLALVLAVPLQEAEKRSTLEERTNSPWTPPSEDLLTALHQANTPNERYKILPPSDFSFSFLDAPSFGNGGKDGGVVLANDEVWPGVIGNGIAMLMGFLGPCGMIAPHSHPRASEIYLNIAGPPLMAGIIPENGAPIIAGFTGPGNATVLPQGSIHFIANTGCDPTVIVAGFNAENPGALFVSSAYAAFDTETYSAAFGGIGVTMLDPAKIPNTVILGRQDCFDSCGINRDSFDISSVSKKDLMLQAYAGFLRTEGFTPPP